MHPATTSRILHNLPSTSQACYSCLVAARNCQRPSITSTRAVSSSPRSPRRGGYSDREDDTTNPYTRFDELYDEFGKARRTPRGSGGGTEPKNSSNTTTKPQTTPPAWALHKATMKELYPTGWNPPRKVSRSDMELIRRLHGIDSSVWSTPSLAERFRISSEAVRRILKSKWRTGDEEDELAISEELEKQASGDGEGQDYASIFGEDGEGGDESAVLREHFGKAPRRKKEPTLRAARPLNDGFKSERNSRSFKWARPERDGEEEERRPSARSSTWSKGF